MSPFLEAALAYAALGLRVFPLEPRAKRPLADPRLGLRNGFHHASADPDLLRRWWGRHPEANVGVVPPADVLVLDGDRADALGGVLLLAPALLEAPLARTGSGGFHLWGRLPEGAAPPPMRAKVVKEYALDVKGLGRSYLVAPPSVHPSGGVYAWEQPLAPLEQLPRLSLAAVHLLHALAGRRTPPPARAAGAARAPVGENAPEGPDSPRLRAYARAELEGRCAEMERTPPGQRHSELVRHAAALWGWVNAGVLRPQDLEALAAAARRAGLGEREVGEVMRWLPNVSFVRSLPPSSR